jgi:hypothetical protein
MHYMGNMNEKNLVVLLFKFMIRDTPTYRHILRMVLEIIIVA